MDEHLEGGLCDLGGDGVSAIGAAVLSRLDGEHDLVVGEDRGDGVDAAGEGLAEDEDVGLHGVVVARQHLPGPAEPGLDLVGNQEGVVSLEELLGSLEVAVVRDHDARLALDWLHHERDDVGVGFEGRLEGTEVVVGDDAEAWHQGPVAAVAAGVRR